MLNEWTISNTSWAQYSVDLSAFAGQTGYIAVRHFNCTDQFAIGVDDFVLDTDAAITIELPVDITAATVYVRMAAGLESGSYDGTLTATAGQIMKNVSLSGEVVRPLATQVMNLVEGWNWWVPTVETTAEAVQAAIGSNCELILSNEGTATDNLIPGKMYKIKVGAACDAEVSGYVPTAITVTVNNGFSWIGYTGTQATAIGTALHHYCQLKFVLCQPQRNNTFPSPHPIRCERFCPQRAEWRNYHS